MHHEPDTDPRTAFRQREFLFIPVLTIRIVGADRLGEALFERAVFKAFRWNAIVLDNDVVQYEVKRLARCLAVLGGLDPISWLPGSPAGPTLQS